MNSINWPRLYLLVTVTLTSIRQSSKPSKFCPQSNIMDRICSSATGSGIDCNSRDLSSEYVVRAAAELPGVYDVLTSNSVKVNLCDLGPVARASLEVFLLLWPF